MRRVEEVLEAKLVPSLEVRLPKEKSCDERAKIGREQRVKEGKRERTSEGKVGIAERSPEDEISNDT